MNFVTESNLQILTGIYKKRIVILGVTVRITRIHIFRGIGIAVVPLAAQLNGRFNPLLT
jgi:hypothetical protein